MTAFGKRGRLAVTLLALAATIAACNGGGSDGDGSPPASLLPPVVSNTTAISVDAGPPGLSYIEANVPFVTVTVCSPGSSANCQTIDHIVLDTGSSGLRLISGAVSASLSLPSQRDARGAPIGECVRFADGSFVWGSVRTADIRIADQRAASAAIQLIGDAALPAVPPGCNGIPSNTVETFGAKGILGVGYFREDCGSFCAQSAFNGQYYSCPASGCVGAAVAQAQQVVHPVALFASNNNGVLISLPAVPAGGLATASGSLTFGIGTQSNNTLGAAKVFRVDPFSGYLTTVFRGLTHPYSLIDSGSTALFLPFAVNIPVCPGTDPVAPGYLCPAVTQNLSAFIQGANGTADSVNFSVANAAALLASFQLTAFSNLAAPSFDPQGFNWGLPFFYGRNVYTAIEGANTPGGVGPFVAF